MTRSKTITTIICVQCGTILRVYPSRSSQQFCSRACVDVYSRRAASAPPNPSGLCQCGCGQPTSIAQQTRVKQGLVKGEPVKFISGHHRKRGALPFIVRDMGYVTPCHVWQGPLTKSGHARFKRNGVTKYAHVHVWEEIHGSVPLGREMHHRCEIPACVNVDHLEPLTRTEHRRRHSELSTREAE